MSLEMAHRVTSRRHANSVVKGGEADIDSRTVIVSSDANDPKRTQAMSDPISVFGGERFMGAIENFPLAFGRFPAWSPNVVARIPDGFSSTNVKSRGPAHGVEARYKRKA
jgi:hypothetical protein